MLQFTKDLFLKHQLLLKKLENILEYLESLYFQIYLIIQHKCIEAGPALGYL